MNLVEAIAGRTSFSHGVHPRDYKELTRDLAIERLPFMSELVLPLSQHLGAPSKAVVRPGERVHRGQVIAEAGGFVSAMLHASATGTVRAIEPRHHPSGNMVDAVVIEPDPDAAQALFGPGQIDWRSLDGPELVGLIKKGGFVGLGGAAFPTHVKLSVPSGKHARFFLVNAAECEPFLNSDYRILLDKTESIFEGIRLVLRALGAERAYIGVEDNKTAVTVAIEQIGAEGDVAS